MHFEPTYHGLHLWFRHIFEVFGWHLLAHVEEGMDYKIKAYLKNIAHLKRSLEDKHKMMECKDKKTDIEIMLRKLKVLETYANKIFKK